MRKIILNLAVSLDGFIEGPKGEFDWCYADQDYGMTEFLTRTDAIFFGRKSYEVLMKMEPNAYPDKMKYIFSNSLKEVHQGYIIIENEMKKKVNEIKSSPGKDIWFYGGSSLCSSFINADLIDEFQLSIHPIILGAGKPLFQDIIDRKKFKLIQSKNFSTGLVQLFYEPL